MVNHIRIQRGILPYWRDSHTQYCQLESWLVNKHIVGCNAELRDRADLHSDHCISYMILRCPMCKGDQTESLILHVCIWRKLDLVSARRNVLNRNLKYT